MFRPGWWSLHRSESRVGLTGYVSGSILLLKPSTFRPDLHTPERLKCINHKYAILNGLSTTPPLVPPNLCAWESFTLLVCWHCGRGQAADLEEGKIAFGIGADDEVFFDADDQSERQPLPATVVMLAMAYHCLAMYSFSKAL